MTVPSSNALLTSSIVILASSKLSPNGSETVVICHALFLSVDPRAASKKSSSSASSKSSIVKQVANISVISDFEEDDREEDDITNIMIRSNSDFRTTNGCPFNPNVAVFEIACSKAYSPAQVVVVFDDESSSSSSSSSRPYISECCKPNFIDSSSICCKIESANVLDSFVINSVVADVVFFFFAVVVFDDVDVDDVEDEDGVVDAEDIWRRVVVVNIRRLLALAGCFIVGGTKPSTVNAHTAIVITIIIKTMIILTALPLPFPLPRSPLMPFAVGAGLLILFCLNGMVCSRHSRHLLVINLKHSIQKEERTELAVN
mmetsp:Transcript_31395/g.75941  ORF Transcript_31395/g.75941 Transcript_31395/m.75941 type:complete len:316 (-) Transcript_31395:23-970(-)